MKTRQDFSLPELHAELAGRYPDMNPDIIKACSYIWCDLKRSLRVKNNRVLGAVSLARMTGLSYGTVKSRLLAAGVPSVLTPKGSRKWDSRAALAALENFR